MKKEMLFHKLIPICRYGNTKQKNHNHDSFWSCYLESWGNTWNLVKARHFPVILLLRAKMHRADRMVPTSSWSHIVFLIGVSSALNTLWHIYVGLVLQLIVWVTNFQHYFTFIDENNLCPTILNRYLLFLLVGVVMFMHFEELTQLFLLVKLLHRKG